jgi:hypothetical protein
VFTSPARASALRFMLVEYGQIRNLAAVLKCEFLVLASIAPLIRRDTPSSIMLGANLGAKNALNRHSGTQFKVDSVSPSHNLARASDL